jgi:hypothetical protein
MKRPQIHRKVATLATTAALGMALLAAASHPVQAQDEGWQTDVFYENDSRYRFEDATGGTVGLSKFRNTLQAEISGKVSGWQLNTTLRGTWDGVYVLNEDEYGKNAGGGITLNSTGGPPPLPHGGGAVNYDVVAGVFGLTDNVFGINSTDPNAPNYNPNEGLRVLGDRWHPVGEGVAFAVPVRPCSVDSRGCTNFGGYGNRGSGELAWSDFNRRLDFLREFTLSNTLPLAGDDQLFVKVGRQQVVWGRTDLFRVLDVINPVDYSRNNIYDELEDIRFPQWIATAEWRMGATSLFQDSNLQVVWNFDKFRPNNLGQCGTANTILDAGCLFRGLKNLWDNGGTVANFANVGPGVLLSTAFGPGQIGIRDVHLPRHTLKNTQIGVKYEGITAGGFAFSLNALHYRSQLPSLQGGRAATNSFTGGACDDGNDRCPYLIAFDMVFPRVNLIGGSADFELQALKAAVRVEAAVTDGEQFANTLKPELYSENNVFRSVVGIDRPTFIPFINPSRTTLISAQIFYQHIFDHERERNTLGTAGMADWQHNVIGTLLIKAFLVNDRVSPQVITAYDVAARAGVTAPSVDWIVNDHVKLTVGANIKWVTGDLDRYEVDDCRSCNPFAPFTAPFGDADPLTPFSRGLSGLEPLGRFRAGPIGAARKEDEIFATLRYAF